MPGPPVINRAIHRGEGERSCDYESYRTVQNESKQESDGVFVDRNDVNHRQNVAAVSTDVASAEAQSVV